MRKYNTVTFTKDISQFLSIAVKQPKAGPQSSGTPFLVIIIIIAPDHPSACGTNR